MFQSCKLLVQHKQNGLDQRSEEPPGRRLAAVFSRGGAKKIKTRGGQSHTPRQSSMGREECAHIQATHTMKSSELVLRLIKY